MKALVTGGAGFVGLHLASHLSEQGMQVDILDNFGRAEKDKEFDTLISQENVGFIKADITTTEAFSQLDTDYDYIYHLAAINGTGNFYKIPEKVLRVNTLGTINLLDWIIGKKGKIVFTSSSEAYSAGLKLLPDFPLPTPEHVPLIVEDPTNVRWSYGASKILGEVAFHSYAKNHDIDYSIVRYHNVYGPRMGHDHVIPQFIERVVKNEKPFKIFGGKQTRAFCYVQDAVRATQLVMESGKKGETYHIGTDDEIKIMDLAKKLFSVMEVSLEIDEQSAPEGSVERRCPDITKLKALGWKPEVDLSGGLKKCVGWYR
ncbi:NAD-dependent epimerase/dehydratase family protein [Candidatus Woesearchaeota archaeon]|nr:NAD-dependent epimerase/dehydratase family protein [Candidatus Woesearchaeota archaeon]